MESNVYTWSIPQKCQTFATMIQHAQNSKELQTQISDIMKHVFGDAFCPIGWNLKSMNKATQFYEFTAVYNFLCVKGPFFSGIFKLSSESNVAFEFPIAHLPESTRHCFADGSCSAFYKPKLHVPMGTSTPMSLLLNPVEFFIFSFVHHLIHTQFARGTSSQVAVDSIYSTLLEEYLSAFVPISGVVPMPQYAGLPWNPPTTPSSPTITPSRKVTLFKTSILGSLTTSPSPTIGQVQQNDAWATEAFIHAVVDLWIDCKVKKDHTNKTMDTSFSQDFENVAIPSIDLVRCVRIFIKHMHSFGNSPAPSGLSALASIKRFYVGYFQKELYIFLTQAVDRWPLDTSFRIVLEMWLSYIQPWRYTERSEAEERCVESKWQFFIAENLLFYTMFFWKILNRLTRMELTYPKHALMLFRVSKVFGLKDLGKMIANAENTLSHSISPRIRTPGPDTELLGIVHHHILQMEGSSYTHVFIFGHQVSSLVDQLLHSAEQAKMRIKNSHLANVPEQPKPSGGFLSKIFHYIFYEERRGGSESDEYKKAYEHLDASVHQLAALFELQVPQIDVEREPSDISAMSINGTPPRGNFSGRPMMTQVLDDQTPFGDRRPSGIVPVRRCDVAYRGNPDKAPVTSYEQPFFVKLFTAISDSINSRFGGEILELYTAPGMKGRVARQVLAMPAQYLEMQREGTRKVYKEMCLPPRINLRPFASYSFLMVTLLVFVLFFLFLGWSSPSIFVSAVLCYGIYVTIKALLYR